MPQVPALFRFLPTIVGLTSFAVMCLLYQCNTTIYLEILRALGIQPWRYPFMDGEFMYAMKHCWKQGIDVYRSVPCDVLPGNKMAYSPLWQRLPMLPDDTAAAVPIGLTTDLLLLISIAWLPPSRSVRDVVLLSMATVSTMVCFALERNNIDVWIYLILFVGCLLFNDYYLSRCLSYALFFVAGLLKYYPMVLFALALRERPTRFWAVAFGCLGGTALFVLGFQQELQEGLRNIPAGSPIYDMVGIVNIPLIAADLVGKTAGEQSITRLSLRLCLTAVVMISAYRLAARPEFAAALARMPEAHSVWLLFGCLVMGGCYLAVQRSRVSGNLSAAGVERPVQPAQSCRRSAPAGRTRRRDTGHSADHVDGNHPALGRYPRRVVGVARPSGPLADFERSFGCIWRP